MCADVRDELRAAAGTPPPLEMAGVRARARQRRGRQKATALSFGGLLASLAVALLVPPTLRTPAAANTFRLPDVGKVRAEQLRDGTPVFVVRHPDGSVVVVEAVSTHLGRVVVWCPQYPGFVDPGPGSAWDDRGRYTYGPAPTDLTTYDVTLLSGTPERIKVGARHIAASRGDGDVDVPGYDGLDGGICGGDGVWDRTPILLAKVRGHAMSLAEADLDQPGRLQLVDATQRWLGNTTTMCAPGPDGCARRELPVAGTRGYYEQELRLDGRYLVRIVHGVVTQLVYAPPGRPVEPHP